MSPELHFPSAAAKPSVPTAPAPSAAARPALPQEQKASVQAPKTVQLTMDPEESRRNLAEAIAKLNEHMKKSGRDLNFSMDEVLDYPVITVKNTTTGEVVRQIPDETLLKVAHSIEDFKGLLHNEWI